MFPSLRTPGTLSVTLAAAGILMVTMGTRQSFGLFVSPLQNTTGMDIATISLALAIGQFVWGAVQPVAGALVIATSKALQGEQTAVTWKRL